jgi:hypothetical protein
MPTDYKTPPFITEPGDVYRSRRSDFLTSHALIDFDRCPLLYKQKTAGLVPEYVGEFFATGAGAHTLILEGRAVFEREYIIGGPINPKTGRSYGKDTKAFADWSAAQSRPVLSDDQYALICNLDAAVRSHAVAAELLSRGQAEGVLRATYCGMPCQIRVDWFNPARGLVDLKTCDDLDRFATNRFWRQERSDSTDDRTGRHFKNVEFGVVECDVKRYRYVDQMTFYREIIATVTGDLVPVYLIAVEKRPPYRCGVWRISDDDLYLATFAIRNAIENLKLCRAEHRWPTGFEDLRTFTDLELTE